MLAGKEDKRPDLSTQLCQTPSWGLSRGLELPAFSDTQPPWAEALPANPVGSSVKSTPRIQPPLPIAAALRWTVATGSLVPQLLPLSLSPM